MEFLNNKRNIKIVHHEVTGNQMYSNPSLIRYSPIIKCMNCDNLFSNLEFIYHVCDYDSNKKLIVLDDNNQDTESRYEKNITHMNNNICIIKSFSNHRKKPLRRLYLCEICGKFLNTLKLHIAYHRNEKLFHCKEQFCDKKFNIRQDLNDHIRKCHTGERPYHCLVCNKRFITRSVFSQHQQIHKGQRRYGCDKCGKRFYRNSALRNHLKIHSEEKPFQCIICSHKFRQKYHIKSHIRKLHPNVNENTGYSLIKATPKTAIQNI